jgi:hypothetical protein
VYYWAITVVSATATAMTALRPTRDYYLFLLGALAFTLDTAGRDYRRRPQALPGLLPHDLAAEPYGDVLGLPGVVQQESRPGQDDRRDVRGFPAGEVHAGPIRGRGRFSAGAPRLAGTASNLGLSVCYFHKLKDFDASHVDVHASGGLYPRSRTNW